MNAPVPYTSHDRRGSESSHRCLSCGTTRNMGRRKYCSPYCRQRLLFKLNQQTGLLRTLNTRYATFHFSDHDVALDILPYGEEDIFSCTRSRALGRLPADEFSAMAVILGNTFWDGVRKTRKRYLACRHVLSRSTRNRVSLQSVRPQISCVPVVRKEVLVLLELRIGDLMDTERRRIIKAAFRRQAKEHHPDHGGDARSFLKIHEAYETLLKWAREPTFTLRRGFVDRWFYEGGANRWIQPMAPRKGDQAARPPDVAQRR